MHGVPFPAMVVVCGISHGSVECIAWYGPSNSWRALGNTPVHGMCKSLGTTLEQCSKILRRLDLTRMWTDLMNPFIKGIKNPFKGFDGQGGGNFRRPNQSLCFSNS